MIRWRSILGLITLALVASPAGALAPVLDDMQSPVIGNGTGPTQATRYVYADAFDLNAMVSDDQTSDINLKWSYEIVGTPKYAVNGDAPLNSGIEDPATPPADKIINQACNQAAGSDDLDATETNPDGKANTITIRNINLYPYGGSPSTDMSATAQNWANHMQTVTFWCSDGNLASSQTVMFYTDNTYSSNTPTGWNRLSGG